jgi:hypothetical protein
MREKASIFFVSVAIIGFQLAIISLLSYSQWHHFAYLAVSIAMLGFGSSGVILSVWVNFFRSKANILLPWIYIGTGLMMFLSPILINHPWFRFDTFLLFTSYNQLVKLLITCFILFIPFLLGATALGLFFMTRSSEIAKLYAWNLAGSAFGGVIMVGLSNYFLPMNLVALFGFGSIISGGLIAKSNKQRLFLIATILTGILVLWLQPAIPFTSEFKSLSKTLLIPGTKVQKKIPLAQGTLEFIASENIRQAQGLNLSYNGSVPIVDIAFLNAQSYCAFERGEVGDGFYNNNLFAFPYLLNKVNPEKVLLLQPNSTFFITQAIELGAKEVKVIEPIKPVADSLNSFNWNRDCVNVVNSYPRAYIHSGSEFWNIILFPNGGSLSSAGLSALEEQYIYTTEAIANAFQRLKKDGILVLSSYMDNPPRYSLKMLALVSESLKSLGLQPSNHIIALRSWNSLLVVVKQISFTENEFEYATNFANDQGFDMVNPTAIFEHNSLSDSLFKVIADEIIFSKRTEVSENYIFNLSAPTDNQPFFSQFMKVSEIRSYFRMFGTQSVPFLELGYFIIWACLLICLLLAILAIAFPLFISLKKRKLILWVWIYFSLLGMAYMLIEIALIQRSILIVGNPITASALVISAMLCFSAVGSFYSAKFDIKRSLSYILISIGFLVTIIAFFGNSLSNWKVGDELFLKIILLVVSIAPLASLMGMAFPMGMRIISERYPDQIPIAWGVNGFFSVLAAPIATIIAIEGGYTFVIMISALFYSLCLLAVIRIIIPKKR